MKPQYCVAKMLALKYFIRNFCLFSSASFEVNISFPNLTIP